MSRFRHIPYAMLTAGGLLVGSGAYAQSMYGIDERQADQQQRIDHGIRSGQLTPGETARLEQGERRINQAQARARADGVVTPQERQHIDGMVNRESRDISRQSHDSQQAWDRGGRDGWGRAGGWDRGRNGGDHRDADRRDWGRDHNGDGGRDGWNHREADRRDWGRDHNWNGNHNGWNQDGRQGWNRGNPGGQHAWGGNQGQGGWQRGSAPNGGSGMANNNSQRWGNGGSRNGGGASASSPSTHSWGGRTQTQAQTAGNYGNNGGRSFTGGTYRNASYGGNRSFSGASSGGGRNFNGGHR